MSVEQALAVRELIAAQVQNQTSKLEHIAEQDPLAVDPEVLAQQIALAERAAVLNKRAAAKQKLAEQARQEKTGDQGKPAAAKQSAAKSPTLDSGPSTANNLAMVTPLEFVKVPGVERPVMKRPSTTFVPLVTSPNPTTETKQGPARNPRGRAGVLARAEAVARNARHAARAAAEKLAEDIVALDVSERLALTDIFLIASAPTERQVNAIVDGIEEELLKQDLRPVRREGRSEGRWVLLDYADIVIHVQHAEDRVFYALERLWKDCPVVDLELGDDASAKAASGDESELS